MDPVLITHRFNDNNDIFLLLMAVDALRREGWSQLHLFLPYFPGARQDRVCCPGECLTVKLYADLINSCKFASVKILCPHSDVATALIDNVSIMDELPLIELALNRTAHAHDPETPLYLISPDAGASKRTEKYAKFLSASYSNLSVLRCEKVRDVSTGKLTGFYVPPIPCALEENATAFIIDDINCMGGTFLGLAAELRKAGFCRIILMTFHSDCKEGVEKILKNNIFFITTNSKKNWSTEINQTIPERVNLITLNLSAQ